MNRAPAFQFYPDKWQSHTRRLSDSAYRVYHELICWMWQQSPDYCSIKACASAVVCATAFPMQVVQAAMMEIQNEFSPLLKESDGKWVCDGLRKEAEKQQNYRKSRSKNGKLGGRPSKAYGKHMVDSAKAKKSSPTPSPSLSTEVQREIDAFPEVLNVPEFKVAWNKWHEHLKQKRKPATIHARDLQLCNLSTMGVKRAIAAINHSIEHNWQGIYEPNNTSNGQASKPNPRNFGIVKGPTDYGTAKPRAQREREAEAARLAGQVASPETHPPAT